MHQVSVNGDAIGISEWRESIGDNSSHVVNDISSRVMAEIYFGTKDSSLQSSFTGKIVFDGVHLIFSKHFLLEDKCGFSSSSKLSKSNTKRVNDGNCFASSLIRGYSSISSLEVCNAPFLSLLLNFKGTYEEHKKACKVLRGSLARNITEGDEKLSENINEQCRSLSVNDAIMWRKSYHLEGNVKVTDKCEVWFGDETVHEIGCIQSCNCSLCYIPTSMEIERYGKNAIFDRRFVLEVDTKNALSLVGDTSSVKRINNSWEMSSIFHDQIHHLNKNTVIPLGRSMSGNESVAFSLCPYDEFSCDDGQCISEDYSRCDGIVQCDDGSDELLCIFIEKTVGYRKEQLPHVCNNVELGKCEKKFNLAFEMKPHYVSDIYSKDEIVTIDFDLKLQWSDERINYWNLKGRRHVEELENVWIPHLLFSSGRFKGQAIEPIMTKDITYIIKNESSFAKRQMEDSFMGTYSSF